MTQNGAILKSLPAKKNGSVSLVNLLVCCVMDYLVNLLCAGDDSLFQEQPVVSVEFSKLLRVLDGFILQESQNTICEHSPQFSKHKFGFKY